MKYEPQATIKIVRKLNAIFHFYLIIRELHQSSNFFSAERDGAPPRAQVHVCRSVAVIKWSISSLSYGVCAVPGNWTSPRGWRGATVCNDTFRSVDHFIITRANPEVCCEFLKDIIQCFTQELNVCASLAEADFGGVQGVWTPLFLPTLKIW